MKLYNGFSPNGARVSIFIAEKSIDLPVKEINVLRGETRTETFLKMNSLGQVPVLELDDGRCLTESVAICRYLEELHPDPALFGSTPEERAFIEMWTRRMELWLFWMAGNIGLHEMEYFRDKVEQNADYAASCRRGLITRLEWLNDEITDGREFVAGPKFSMADIIGMTTLMIMQIVQIELPSKLTHLKRWEAAVIGRPSFPKFPQAA